MIASTLDGEWYVAKRAWAAGVAKHEGEHFQLFLSSAEYVMVRSRSVTFQLKVRR